LGVWILDGDVACSAPLLKFAIKPETLENTIVILVASMTQPWSLLSTLKKWTTLIEEHIDRLKIDPTRLRELRDHLQYDFQHYIEPNDSSVMLTSSTTIKSGMGGGRVPNSVSSVSLASITPLDPTNGEEQIVIPLADGVLTKSLGIQIIVVITKVKK
jgi:dynein light intermediate chain 1